MAGRAPSFETTRSQCESIVEDAKKGVFKPVYLLMGAEPFYTDLACKAIIETALLEHERDFNQSIFYGTGTSAHDVASEARLYPMMAERRLVVLKDAQDVLPGGSYEELASY